jgi:hypothetical protein
MRRPLEDGPWMFGKDLVVMMELDETKEIEEMEFVHIPIWVRVLKLPLGMMNKATGEAIGEELGSFMTMDLDEDGTARGRYLRIKVHLDIRKPLMRGVTMCVGEEENPLWCPLEYEFLPDYCYMCGVIGHVDRNCVEKVGKGEIQQFSKKLRCILDKRRLDEGNTRFGGGSRGSFGSWRSGSSGSRGSFGGSGNMYLSGRNGSDTPTWRKDDGRSSCGEKKERKKGEEEVTSPLKMKEAPQGDGKSKRVLFLGGGSVGTEVQQEGGEGKTEVE